MPPAGCPGTRGLGLLDAGVEVRADGSVPVDGFSQTNVPSVFAVGDITHRINLTPVAIHEGHAFADTQFGGIERSVDHEFVPSAVFSHPQVGSVGFPEHEARNHYGELMSIDPSSGPCAIPCPGARKRP